MRRVYPPQGVGVRLPRDWGSTRSVVLNESEWSHSVSELRAFSTDRQQGREPHRLCDSVLRTPRLVHTPASPTGKCRNSGSADRKTPTFRQTLW